jgi:ABC-type sugar transport system substrate-binding protein
MRGGAPFAARQYLSAEGSLEKGAEPSEGPKTREKTVTHSPKLRLCCSILALVAGLSAGVAEAKDETLGVFYLNSLGFFVQIGDGIKAVVEEQGGGEILETVSNDNPVPESEFADTIISAKVNAVLISPTSVDASVVAIERIVEAGIPVICYNTCINDADRERLVKGFFTTDQYAFGYELGKVAAQYAVDNGISPKLGLLNCDRYEACQERKKGFLDAMTEKTTYEILSDQESWIADEATAITQDMLTSNPEINMMWAAAEGGSVGAMLAVEYSGQEGKTVVFGSDLIPQMVEFLRKGTILKAAIAQSPVDIGRAAAERAFAVIGGDKGSPAMEVIPATIYTPADTDALSAWMKANGYE